MSNIDRQQMERGISFVNERIVRSRDRICVLNSHNRLRDKDEIWEAYYDLEEAILMSKVIFRGFDKPGKRRRLPKIANLSDEEVRAKFKITEASLRSAERSLTKQAGDETIEFLRRARDQLKLMLLVYAPSRPAKKVWHSAPP